jgi:uncharacterized protein (UPF0332 family)
MSEERRQKIITLTLAANTALHSSKLLMMAGDVDGSGNRSYYASFHASRAALAAAVPGFELEDTKTHGSIIGQVGLKLVKEGLLPKETGRSLNQVQDLRLLADYRVSSLSRDEVVLALTLAGRVVTDCTALVESKLDMKLSDMVEARKASDIPVLLDSPKPS